ncbi:MAG: hypothetical protein HYW47_00310 [Deltaproteobacteria bacterium]|nr:hypothetical protein [Deltaproteobacteria bacterium]
MKKFFVLVFFISFSSVCFAGIPKDLEERLLSHPWNGFITNVDSLSNSQIQILINFIRDERGPLNATITLYNYETGNGRFNFTRFADVKYNNVKEHLLISWWPPLTPKNRQTWILESTFIADTFISGLFLEQPRTEEPDVLVEKGTFRIQ